MPNQTIHAIFGAALLASCGSALAQSGSMLARYFGFEPPRVLVIDDDFGPVIAADFDADGLMDLGVVNNRKSRIEIHTQRRSARTDAELERSFKVNELPPNPWFDRKEVSVAHRVTAVRAYDVDGDGRLDLVYAGHPGEIVVMRQTSTLQFEVAAKRRVRNLASFQDGFRIADVMGDDAPELLAMVEGRINVWSFGADGPIGEPTVIGSGGEIIAFFTDDYDGDGMLDIMGAIPDDDAPVRIWLQSRGAELRRRGKSTIIGPELRFEMPSIIEMEPIHFGDRAAASIGIIEKATRRIVLYDLEPERIDPLSGSAGEREAPAEVRAFPGSADPKRSVEVADLDADGMADLLVTDKDTNSVALYRQVETTGLADHTPFSAFKAPQTVAAGQWDDDKPLEVFVLSAEEKAVGISEYDPRSGRLGFPQPLDTATAGAEPVAMSFATWNDSPTIAVVMQRRRDHTLELHRRNEPVVTLEMEEVNRPPQAIFPGDFDDDGRTDFMLFTPNEPMVMVRTVENEEGVGLELLTDETMRQYGLVQAAGPSNTAMLDVDGDGAEELLIADENFVRACRFDAERGWRVVDQITMPDSSASLVGVTVLTRDDGSSLIVAADRATKNLVLMGRTDVEGGGSAWDVVDKLHLAGFDLGAIRAGSFTGDREESILCLAPDAFAIVRLAGWRLVLEEFSAYRSDLDDRLEHEMEVGDVNADGYVDLVVLDAREQMCQIFSLSATRQLVFANEFKVFESRLFRRGDTRDYQPSAAILEDFTGDGATDMALLVHDRIVLYPQMTQ